MFYQDYAAREGNFKSRPPLSPWPRPWYTFWKAETMGYIRLVFVSQTLSYGAYLGRIFTESPPAAKCLLSTFFEMTNVAAISTRGFTHCCGDQPGLALRHYCSSGWVPFRSLSLGVRVPTVSPPAEVRFDRVFTVHSSPKDALFSHRCSTHKERSMCSSLTGFVTPSSITTT